MCHQVIFEYQNLSRKVSFASPNARLPVLTKQKEIKFMPWGRKKHQPGKLPLGGLALLESIYEGEWDRFFPKPVKLPIKSFCIRDFEDKPHWYHLSADKWIQGIIARENNEEVRVYIVTLSPDENEFIRWPRILYG
jgi:hypothetical protein